jgi:hypothetical protein
MSKKTTTRPRGFAPWNPTAESRGLIEKVLAVLAEYGAYLPLTVRQIFYRLVGASGYEKTEAAYERLGAPSRFSSPFASLCLLLYETRSLRVNPSWQVTKLTLCSGSRSLWP